MRSNYRKGRGIQLIHLILPRICTCPKPEPGFPMTYFVLFFVINCMKWEIIGRFVDVGGIVGHYYLNCVFMADCRNDHLDLGLLYAWIHGSIKSVNRITTIPFFQLENQLFLSFLFMLGISGFTDYWFMLLRLPI